MRIEWFEWINLRITTIRNQYGKFMFVLWMRPMNLGGRCVCLLDLLSKQMRS